MGLPGRPVPPPPPLGSLALSLGLLVPLAFTPGASGGLPELPLWDPPVSPLVAAELRLFSFSLPVLLSWLPLPPLLLPAEGVPLSLPSPLPRPLLLLLLLLLPEAFLERSFGGGECSAPTKLFNTSSWLQSL